MILEAAGFGEWNNIEKFWEIKAIFEETIGADRVLVSQDGINAVGKASLRKRLAGTVAKGAIRSQLSVYWSRTTRQADGLRPPGGRRTGRIVPFFRQTG
jgi:hypothetical protein